VKVGFLGSGPLGRALAQLARDAGNEVLLSYRRTAPRRLPATSDLAEVGAFADLIVAAVPPDQLSGVCRAAGLGPGHRVLIAARGLEPGEGRSWLSEIVPRETSCLRVGVIGGPAVAAEILAGRRGAGVVASPFEEVRLLGQQALHSPRYRVYPSPDLRGVELAGAMVQVIAVAVGMADGMGMGAGIRGVVFARGLAEAGRLAEVLGADPRTFGGLVGAGDLVASCSHTDHPAYGAGLQLARGQEAASHDAINTAGAAIALAAQRGVELPLARAVWAVARKGVPLPQVMQALMERPAAASEL
jgi:glycerol-3-phosphate dehydrogenase (NAD(P)+)